MSTRFAQIDLSRLPAPEVIEPLDYEAMLAEMKAFVAERDPDLSAVLELESEPAVKVLQAAAYFRLLDRARVNDAARAVLLAHATGADLDNLAALLGVSRLVVAPGDLIAAPPTAPVMESDMRFRARVQLSLQAFSSSGSAGAYRYWAITASADVLDAHPRLAELGPIYPAGLALFLPAPSRLAPETASRITLWGRA
ncbi:baseplate J/gp47 family protein [Roseinatronobacter sp.]|uniref:baseplate J/gp47 family protein n=1 Tax=Roseinatronobacter sp. TaxID=1945755 RepID=UPI0025F817D7|nr:tail protein X [Roseibaca sp.]